MLRHPIPDGLFWGGMRFFAAVLLPFQLLGQSVSAGLRAGVPITPLLTAESPQRVSTPRFTIGPLVEFRLSHGLNLAADFLLRRTGFAIPAVGSGWGHAWRWEAPVTAIYRFRAPAHPFVRTGVVLHAALRPRCSPYPKDRVLHWLGWPAATTAARNANVMAKPVSPTCSTSQFAFLLRASQ